MKLTVRRGVAKYQTYIDESFIDAMYHHDPMVVGMIVESERQNLLSDIEADIAHEERLAREYCYGESEIPWPWYADKPYRNVDDC